MRNMRQDASSGATQVTPDTYILLTALTLAALLGFALGFWLCLTAVNWLMSKGTLDVYRDGTRLEIFRMW
jgi:hypothetical protein